MGIVHQSDKGRFVECSAEDLRWTLNHKIATGSRLILTPWGTLAVYTPNPPWDSSGVHSYFYGYIDLADAQFHHASSDDPAARQETLRHKLSGDILFVDPARNEVTYRPETRPTPQIEEEASDAAAGPPDTETPARA